MNMQSSNLQISDAELAVAWELFFNRILSDEKETVTIHVHEKRRI